MSNPFQKFQVHEMDAGANVLNFPNTHVRWSLELKLRDTRNNLSKDVVFLKYLFSQIILDKFKNLDFGNSNLSVKVTYTFLSTLR